MIPSKRSTGLKPCGEPDCHCDGVDGAGWHVSLVEMNMPKTEDGARQMARDYFADLGMGASF